jgi:hypothetical protein
MFTTGPTVIKSRPADVLFCGFRSTTSQLQNAGWELSMHEDFENQHLTLAMRHKQAGVYAMSARLAVDHFAYWQMRGDMRLPPFVVTHISSDIRIVSGVDFTKFKPIDAAPQVVRVDETNISQLSIFASQLVRTEEIIVEPQSVAECLSLIKRLQAPQLAEIRERNRRAEAMPQVQFHAQIMSLAA